MDIETQIIRYHELLLVLLISCFPDYYPRKQEKQYFQIFQLSTMTDVDPRAARVRLLELIEGHTYR